jgi:TusA-related sulfurtransferase
MTIEIIAEQEIRELKGVVEHKEASSQEIYEEVSTMASEIIPDAELDCVGLYCPMPIAQTKQEIDRLEVGQLLKVEADDPAAEEDIKRWAKRVGHEILKFEKQGTIMTFYIKKMK